MLAINNNPKAFIYASHHELKKNKPFIKEGLESNNWRFFWKNVDKYLRLDPELMAIYKLRLAG